MKKIENVLQKNILTINAVNSPTQGFQTLTKIASWCLLLLLVFILSACNEDDDIDKAVENKKPELQNGLDENNKLLDSLESKQLSKAAEKDNAESIKHHYDKTSFEILDFSERDYNGASTLGLVLSVPLNRRTDFQKFLVLERKGGELVDGAWILSDNGKELFFKNIEPESDYLLTVYANLKSFDNKELKQRFKKAIKTKAIEASVSFAHDGGVLPLTHSKGLPVYSVNVKAVDIEFHRIKKQEMLSFLQSWRGGKENYYHLQQYSEKSEFVYSARFDLPVEKNKRERVILPLDAISELKPAGVYLAVMKTAGKYDYRQAVTYFIRSDIGVHVRRYPGQLHAYLRSLITGESLKNISVSLLDKNSQLLIQSKTDQHGVIHFENHLKKAHLLVAQTDQNMSLVRLNSPALDLSEFNVGQRKYYQNEAFFYAPRDLYRPGEQVDISLLLRDFDGHLLPDIPLKAAIKRPDGQIVQQFTWKPHSMGYYHHQYQLSDSIPTGKWRIEIELPEEKNNTKNTRNWSFSVEDFLPERMKLTLNEAAQGRFITSDDKLDIAVDGQYLYGAPAAGNRLETQVKTFVDQQALESLPGYHFGLAEEQQANMDFSLDTIQLNEQGKGELNIPSHWQSVNSPIAIRVISSLFETGGRAVKRQADYRLWPAETLVGIHPQWLKSDDNSTDEESEPQANSILGFDIVNADKNGQLHKADNLVVTLIKKRRDYYWKYNNSDEWEMDYSEKQYPVFNQTLNINKDQKATLKIPVEWGHYRLEILNQATNLTSSVEFNAGGSWYYRNQQARIARPDKINLSLDKERYGAGEKALLTIKSPFKGQGILLVENNDGLLWQHNIDMSKANELSVSVPVNQDWKRHDIYISTVLFNQPEQSTQSQMTAQKTDKTIKRAIGLAHLPLERTDREIGLTLSTAEKARPFTTLPVKIQINEPQKYQNKTVMMTLAAVDVGVLNVSNFSTPDAFSWFFAQRRYDVDSLDMYGQIIDGRNGISGQHRFGGDMDVSSAGNLHKARIKIVSIFHKPVRFNAQGEADVELDIPDFNGQLRLMALAYGESSYGKAEKNIIIASPLVTQLSMPLFLAAYDKSTLTLDVHNLTEQNQTIGVQMTGDNVIEVLESNKQLSLAPDEKTAVYFTVKSKQQFGLSTLTLNISNQTNPLHEKNNDEQTGETENEISLSRQWQLAVRPAWPAVQRNTQRMMINNTPVSLSVKSDDLMPDTVTGRLLVSNQPPINLASHMKHLLKYPYGCLEQTTSSSFPWLFSNKDTMDKLGLNKIKINNKAIDYSERETYLSRGVQRLSAKQLSNGGFGLWSNQSSEEFWLSAYATHFLLQAKDQNIDVSSSVLKAAIKRLQQYLRSTRPGYDYRYSQKPEHLTLAYKAYAAYVLSSMKQAPLGTMRTLYDYHLKDAHSGLPLMHLGIALSRQGDLKRGKEAIERSLTVKREAEHYLGDYGSTLRDLSLMLDALLRFESTHDGVSDLLFQLQEELGKRHWLSTQERNALFMAGVALQSKGQKQWQAIIETVLGKYKIIHEGDFQYAGNYQELSDAIQIQSTGDDRLYASLDINGYTTTPPETNFEHFNINRTYYNSKGEVILPQRIAVGELMIVELSLHSKDRIQDTLVVDLIPAGFEIENQNLTHSLKLDDYHIGDKSIADMLSKNTIKYQQWRDDRYVAAMDLQGHGVQRVYYLLRAVTPGTYQVPPPYAEDMYRPYIRAIGETPQAQTILNRQYPR